MHQPSLSLVSLLAALALGACLSSDPSAQEISGETPLAAPSEAPPVTLRVAACQILVDGNREAAFERIDAALAEAARQSAQIACFPEACLFGWVNPEAHAWADPIPGPTTARLGLLARRYQIMIALGLAERDGAELHNAAVLIDVDGALLLRHRKLNVLSELMQPPYVPGIDARASFADTRFGRIGMLICADTFVDSIVQQLSDVRPDLMLVPYGWAAPAEAWPAHGESLHAWIASTAQRTGAPTLGVDSTGAIEHGPWKGMLLGGQSAWSNASGALSTPLADRESQVVVFELPWSERARS